MFDHGLRPLSSGLASGSACSCGFGPFRLWHLRSSERRSRRTSRATKALKTSTSWTRTSTEALASLLCTFTLHGSDVAFCVRAFRALKSYARHTGTATASTADSLWTASSSPRSCGRHSRPALVRPALAAQLCPWIPCSDVEFDRAF